eukprot:IDg23844t1
MEIKRREVCHHGITAERDRRPTARLTIPISLDPRPGHGSYPEIHGGARRQAYLFDSDGDGVPKDAQAARALYQRVIDAGNVDA